MLARRAPHRVDRLPRDDHGHDGGLACAGGQFQRQAHQFGIGISVRRREMVKQALPVLGLGRDLSEPYRGFHRLHLAEEGADTAEFMMAPVLKEPGRLRRDLPLIGIGQGTPCVHVTAELR